MSTKNSTVLTASNFATAKLPGAAAYRREVAGWATAHGDADQRRRLASKRDTDHLSARLELGLAGMWSCLIYTDT